MTLVPNVQTNSKTYTVYLYHLEVLPIFKVNPNFKRVEIQEQDFTVLNMTLAERLVAYLPPQQKAELPQHILDNKAFVDFLNACSLMISVEDLPRNITEEERQNHQFDSVMALELLKFAAKQGLALAQNNLACCYLMGKGHPVDKKKAVVLFQKVAIEQQYPPAQSNLGFCYHQGEGVPFDMAHAIAWYQKAANAGHVMAKNNLGACYLEGQGVKQNLKKAAAYFQESSDAGNELAQGHLALCYHKGYGVLKDLNQAEFWYEKAITNGYLDAVHILKIIRAEKESLGIKQKKDNQVNLQILYKVKFDGFMKSIHDHMGHYEALKAQWLVVMGKDLQIKCCNRIQMLEADVNNNVSITPKLLNEIEELSKNFPQALQEAERSLQKARAKADRKAHQEARRASQKFEIAPVIVEPLIEDPAVSETRLIKERLVQEAEAKEKRKSITLERRLSRTISRSSLKLDFQQTQEQLAKEKERHEQRKSQRLSKLYTKEELIAAGILPAEDSLDPVKTHGRIASFEKTTQEIFDEQRAIGEYTFLVRDLLRSFAKADSLKAFKKNLTKKHEFEKLKKGLGGLVGVDHLKPWEKNGCHIYSFRVSPTIPERIVFAWDKKEKKAYQMTFVNYHAK